MHEPNTVQADLSRKILDGKYELLQLIGRGSSGSVYKALQMHLARTVAIKILNSDLSANKEKLKRFQSEARIASQLDHENLVTTYSFGITEDNRPYVVLKYIAGVSLESYITNTGALSISQAKTLFSQICWALQAVHSNEIVHRDVSAANIFIEDTGESLKAYLGDFGLAKSLDLEPGQQKLTATGVVLGTPSYMSPEQCLNGIVDKRSDIYSLGAVIFKTLLGRTPFEAETEIALMHKHLHERLQLSSADRAKIGSQFTNIIVNCLEKDPSKRYQSASKLLEAIERIEINKQKPAIVCPKKLLFGFVLSVLVISGISTMDKFRLPNKQQKVSRSTPYVKPLATSNLLEACQTVAEEINTSKPLAEQNAKELEQEINKRLASNPGKDKKDDLLAALAKIEVARISSMIHQLKPDKARSRLEDLKALAAQIHKDVQVKSLVMLLDASLTENDKECESKIDEYMEYCRNQHMMSNDIQREKVFWGVLCYLNSASKFAIAHKYCQKALSHTGNARAVDVANILTQQMLCEKKLGLEDKFQYSSKALANLIGDCPDKREMASTIIAQANYCLSLDEPELASQLRSIHHRLLKEGETKLEE